MPTSLNESTIFAVRFHCVCAHVQVCADVSALCVCVRCVNTLIFGPGLSIAPRCVGPGPDFASEFSFRKTLGYSVK